MKKLNRNKVVLWILCVILCVTACGPAFASAGDRVLYRSATSEDGGQEAWIDGVWKSGDSFYVLLRGWDETILRFKDLQSEPEQFVLSNPGYSSEEEETESTIAAPETSEQKPVILGIGDEEEEDEEDDEDEGGFLIARPSQESADENQQPAPVISGYFYPECWFEWKGELYALASKMDNQERASKVECIETRRAKLENGQIILEDSGLPELDKEYLIESYDDSEYFAGLYGGFTAGNYLVTMSYGATPRVIIFDLTDGSCRTIDTTFEYNIELAPNDDSSFLLSKGIWTPDYSTADVSISKVNLEDLTEEPLTEVKGMKDSRLSLCYDKENNILYYVSSGELWAMPDLDQEKAQAVNECPEASPNTILLPDGYVLIWSNKSVIIRNTDPTQRAGTTLRVFDTFGGDLLNEAIFEMSKNRSDVSVVLQQEWDSKNDILQAMMNRDGGTDIYVLRYEGNDFRALKNRGYTADLSDNAQIAGYFDRMYPWVQDALKKDGKIIGIPLYFYGDALNINLAVWKKIGGTEEELPKTWNQFFDWVATMPKRLEGTDTVLVESYMDQQYLRSSITQIIMSEYQAVMDSKGVDYSYNSPMLTDLLKRLDTVDYEALGIPEEYVYDENNESEYTWHEPLLNSYGYNGYNSYADYTPLVLGLTEEEPAVMPVTIYTAFVNPYSEHQEEAKELLALMLKNEDIYTQYGLYTDKTEPVKRPDAEELKERHEKDLADMKKQLERATDETRSQLEEAISSEEKYWAENGERLSWTISQAMIDGYLKLNPFFRVQDYVLIDDLWDTDDQKERDKIMNSLFGYYVEEEEKVEKISLEEVLNLIDQKIQMKRKEGN